MNQDTMNHETMVALDVIGKHLISIPKVWLIKNSSATWWVILYLRCAFLHLKCMLLNIVIGSRNITLFLDLDNYSFAFPLVEELQ